MAISFVGSKTYSAAGANSGTFSVSLTDLLTTAGGSATLQQGDWLIITNVVGGTTDKAQANLLASGWTACHTDLYANGSSSDCNFQVQKKQMGATPDTSVSIPNSGSTADAVAGTVFAFRGVGSVVFFNSSTGTGTGRPTPSAVTPTVAGSWIVCSGGAAAATGAAFTNPGDLSTTTNHFRSVSSPDTVDAMAGCGIKTNWVSGQFTPSQWTGGTTGAGDSNAAASLILEPDLTQSLTPGLFTNSQSFFSPTISTANTLSPALFTNSQSFPASTLLATYTLAPGLFTNAQSFFTATVSQDGGQQTLTPSLFTNTNTFPPATLTASFALAPALFVSGQTFYVPSITADQVLAPLLFINDNPFFTATVMVTGRRFRRRYPTGGNSNMVWGR